MDYRPLQINTDGVVTSGASMPSAVETAMPFNLEDEHFSNLAASTFNIGSDFDTFNYVSTSWQDLMNLGSEITLESSVSDRNSEQSFHFLDNFTSKTGLVCSFDCGTLNQREQVSSTFLQFEVGYESVTRQTASRILGEDTWPATESTTSTCLMDRNSLNRQNWTYDRLILITHQILVLVKEVVTVKPRNSAVELAWSPVLEKMCIQFFSPVNLRRFLELYWAIWHPNVNFMHQPTFDPASSKPVLIASMAVIGWSSSLPPT
jgi:hypothetical protein